MLPVELARGRVEPSFEVTQGSTGGLDACWLNRTASAHPEGGGVEFDGVERFEANRDFAGVGGHETVGLAVRRKTSRSCASASTSHAWATPPRR